MKIIFNITQTNLLSYSFADIFLIDSKVIAKVILS